MSEPTNRFERLPLAALPSPLMKLDYLAARLETAPIYMKRDDLLGRVLGGNKLRKLEYILPAALADGAEALVTTGSFESNHVCLTVAVARMLGLRAVIVTMGDPQRTGLTTNLLLSRTLGAEVHVVEFSEDDAAARASLSARVAARVEEVMKGLETEGAKPFFVPGGGCSVAGAASFAAAFGELHEEMLSLGVESYDVALAVGTGSTLAGLWCGRAAAEAEVGLRGFSIARPNPRCRELTLAAIREAAEVMQLAAPATAEELEIDDRFIGDGYGQPTAEGRQAIDLMMETEAILLDPVYTGKMVAGVLALVSEGELGGRPLVLWHTGGVAGLFDELRRSGNEDPSE